MIDLHHHFSYEAISVFLDKLIDYIDCKRLIAYGVMLSEKTPGSLSHLFKSIIYTLV